MLIMELTQSQNYVKKQKIVIEQLHGFLNSMKQWEQMQFINASVVSESITWNKYLMNQKLILMKILRKMCLMQSEKSKKILEFLSQLRQFDTGIMNDSYFNSDIVCKELLANNFFKSFKTVYSEIESFICSLHLEHTDKLSSLLTPKFELFDSSIFNDCQISGKYKSISIKIILILVEVETEQIAFSTIHCIAVDCLPACQSLYP